VAFALLSYSNADANFSNFQDVTDAESRLAAGVIALEEPFCQYFQSLITRLLSNTQSHSAKVKSRAMASLTQMIEKDPQILNDRSFPGLARLIGDNSPMVRENTVSLITRCIEQNPSLERHCLQGVLNLMTDQANGPKKKAIRLLRDIYANTTDKDKKVRIATELLLPIIDEEKAIVELTRQTLEDIWITPLRATSKMDENQVKLDRETRVALLISTAQNIQARPAHLRAFEAFFTTVLSPAAKNAAENFKICKEIVADMVEGVIGTDSTSAENSQARILQTLSVFAKINPRLFTPDQVQLLKLYVKNLATTEDLAVFRPTVIIFRYVFPALSTLQEPFLEEVRDSLSRVTGKLAMQAAQGNSTYKQTLLDIAHCSWMISPLVKGDPPRVKSGMEKLISMICSVAAQLEPLSTFSKETPPPEKRILCYMILLGTFGKVCDFDQYVEMFRANLMKQVQQNITSKKSTAEQLKRLIGWKSPSVAVLLLDLVLPFTKQAWDISIREQALCSLGEICQQKTKHFTRADIEKAFKLPFINKDGRLIRAVLTQFRDFLETAERRSETGAEIAVGEGAVHGAERLETSFTASDNDHATTHIARAFLPNVIDTALGKAGELALPATEILVSISRQGLLHPKECGAALVALSTSLNPQIALKASEEQRKIHLQHETMFEKEYVAAVTLAFNYQRDVFDDPRGAINTTYRPKMQLLFEAFKQGSRKTLKKFVTNLLNQLDFELPKLDATSAVPEAVLFARFCLENCSFFDYAKVDEVMHVILSIESIVLKQTGPSVALAIETEMPEQQLEQPLPENPVDGLPTEQVAGDSAKSSISVERLRQLTAASIILHMMWEARSFLRRAFNLQGKIITKDMQKPATRINFITGKELWERFTALVTALDTPDAMKKQCSDFAEIINVDREHAVQDEDVDASEQLAKAAAGYETPDEGEGGDAPAPPSGKGRKRKSSAGLGSNTPKKPRSRASGGKGKTKRNSKTPDSD
jgi:cohesin loading factor subunit SCC2